MSIHDAIVARFAAHAGTFGLVGGRVYPQILPQKPDYPAITYQQISGGNLRTLAGPSGMGQPRVQIDCWAKTQLAANAVATQVRLALDGWKGSAGGVTVRSGALDSRRDFYEPDPKIYRVSLDFTFLHDEELA